MTKRVLEDGLGIRDKRAIKGQFRVEARCKKVDRRIAPNAKQWPRHLRVKRPLCPYDFPATAEDVCQDIGLSWKIARIEMDVETLRPSQKAAGQRAKGPGNRAPLLVDVRHDRRVVAHRCHVMIDDIFSKQLKGQEQRLHLEKIDVQQLLLVRLHPRHVLIEEVGAPPRTRRVRIQVKIRSRCPELKPRQKMVPHHPPRQIPSRFLG